MSYKITTLCMLFIFLSIGLFGFFAMGVMDHGERGSCPFSFFGSTPCPQSGKFTAILHHINFLDKFLKVTLNAGLSGVLFLLAFVISSAVYLYKILELKQTNNWLNLVIKSYRKLHRSIPVSVFVVLKWLGHIYRLDPEGPNIKAHNSMSLRLCWI